MSQKHKQYIKSLSTQNTTVPSLKELAIQCVIRNIEGLIYFPRCNSEALESLGDIPKEFSDRIFSARELKK